MKTHTILFLLFFLSNCQQNETTQLRIATAANVQFAMEDLIVEFTKQTGITCTMITSSSGKLTAQIQQAAPYDVFVSADRKYPMELYQSKKTLTEPKVYALGGLVLWTRNEKMIPNLSVLENKSTKHIAIANPQIAPYGQAAIQVLKHYQKYKTVKDKLVFGESIAQTNQFIISQAADFGFTAKSVVLSSKMKGVGNWIELDTSSYQAIEQAAVVIDRKEKTKPEAKQFFDFLFSEKAKIILKQYGYK